MDAKNRARLFYRLRQLQRFPVPCPSSVQFPQFPERGGGKISSPHPIASASRSNTLSSLKIVLPSLSPEFSLRKDGHEVCAASDSSPIIIPESVPPPLNPVPVPKSGCGPSLGQTYVVSGKVTDFSLVNSSSAAKGRPSEGLSSQKDTTFHKGPIGGEPGYLSLGSLIDKLKAENKFIVVGGVLSIPIHLYDFPCPKACYSSISSSELSSKWKLCHHYPVGCRLPFLHYPIKVFDRVSSGKVRLIVDGRHLFYTTSFLYEERSISVCEAFRVFNTCGYAVKVDIKNAFNNLPIALYEKSRKKFILLSCSLNGHRFYRDWRRGIIFGWAASPFILQCFLETILKCIHCTFYIYMDDVIIGGPCKSVVDAAVEAFIHYLDLFGMHLNKEKMVAHDCAGDFFGWAFSKDPWMFTQTPSYDMTLLSSKLSYRSMAAFANSIVYDPMNISIFRSFCNSLLMFCLQGFNLSKEDWDKFIPDNVARNVCLWVNHFRSHVGGSISIPFIKSAIIHVDAAASLIACRLEQGSNVGRIYFLSAEEKNLPIWLKELTAILQGMCLGLKLYRLGFCIDCEIRSDSMLALWAVFNRRCKSGYGSRLLKKIFSLSDMCSFRFSYVGTKNNIADKWSRLVCFLQNTSRAPYPSRIWRSS